jgi:hypothetical protein
MLAFYGFLTGLRNKGAMLASSFGTLHVQGAARTPIGGAIEAEIKEPKPAKQHPLAIQAVPIDDKCTGDRWSAVDEVHLAQLIAIIAMGQAVYVAYLLRELLPAAPAFNDDDLRREAKIRLTVQEDGKHPRTGYPRWQRDGFIFEAISWIAARQAHGQQVLLKEPHVSSTSQGLDGVMIELAPDKSKVTMTTIFEDKCTDDPRNTFLSKVIPALLDRHQNKRSAELVSIGSLLLRTAGIDEGAAAQLAAAVMDRSQRSYRAAFALTEADDSQAERQKLFKGFDQLDKLSAKQRIGAGLIVGGKMRTWFDALALRGIEYLDKLATDKKS